MANQKSKLILKTELTGDEIARALRDAAIIKSIKKNPNTRLRELISSAPTSLKHRVELKRNPSALLQMDAIIDVYEHDPVKNT